MLKEALYFAFIGGILFLMVSIQGLVSPAFMDFLGILVFIMFVIMFIGIIDRMFLRRKV